MKKIVGTVSAAGAYLTVWRGRNDSGRAVASEVYLGVVETAAGRATTPISLVR